MAELHPVVVHFTIVLLVVGVAFRLLSLVSRLAFAGPAAATMLIAAAVSSIPSVQSGSRRTGPWSVCPVRAPPSSNTRSGASAPATSCS
jgi:hypothetical protein